MHYSLSTNYNGLQQSLCNHNHYYLYQKLSLYHTTEHLLHPNLLILHSNCVVRTHLSCAQHNHLSNIMGHSEYL